MSDSKFPPRVGVERQHICALTGQLRWSGLTPRAHYIIDPVVNDEYLSLSEHEHLLAQERAKAKELVAALERIREGNALMAEGEGPDPQVYMDMANHWMHEADKALAKYRGEE